MPPDQPPPDPFDYSPHALRLDGREWLIVATVVLLFAFLAPRLWTRAEPFTPEADYRVPYELSDDYWLYQRHLEEAAADRNAIFVIGDSVVWGEYVAPDGTLSHFLNAESDGGPRFVNAGVNGLFPLALEGLVRDFGQSVKHRRVLLHANLLWMTSPEADLSAEKEQKFNHEPLVPQFATPIPCYRAGIDRRLSHLARRKVGLFSWSEHLQIAYFGQMSIPHWTLQPGHAYLNPLPQLNRGIPGEPADDPDRGEASERHRPWSHRNRKPQAFDWVAPAESLQFAAFQRLVTLLRQRGNKVLVVIGPLNRHMIASGSRSSFDQWQGELVNWLDQRDILHFSPATLPSDLYGDASHPLTGGYRQLARELLGASVLRDWLKTGEGT